MKEIQKEEKFEGNSEIKEINIHNKELKKFIIDNCIDGIGE